MDTNIADHPVIKALSSEVERLKRRVEGLESILREEHEKLEKLEHEHGQDHVMIERLEHTGTAAYYGRRAIAVGL